MRFLRDEDLATLRGAEHEARTPLPLQVVSSDEYLPPHQSAKQREVGVRLNALADDIAPRQGMSRRRFFQTSAGMAAAFVAMNEVYGAIFAATRAEARTPEMADARAAALKDQFIIDLHHHFLREDWPFELFSQVLGKKLTWDSPDPGRNKLRELGWDPQMKGEQTGQMARFAHYRKEIFLDSDTKIGLISGGPQDDPRTAALPSEGMAAARNRINAEAGSRRMLSHCFFTPGKPNWLADLDVMLKTLKPDSVKCYTYGSGFIAPAGIYKPGPYHWRMDSEEAYKGYEKLVAAGIKNVCVHKGLYPPSLEKAIPSIRPYVDVSDVGPAAKDWSQLNFIVYHAGYRHHGGTDPNGIVTEPAFALAEFERTGRIDWSSDLADISAKYGVTNVYADLGMTFAFTIIAQPRLCAALLGVLIKGLGADHVCWGTDAVFTGSPQWQIEGLRRLEIPEDMQKRYRFAPLGAATGPVKTAIFTDNNARLYNIDAQWRAAVMNDNIAKLKIAYEQSGRDPSNLRYGYVMPG